MDSVVNSLITGTPLLWSALTYVPLVKVLFPSRRRCLFSRTSFKILVRRETSTVSRIQGSILNTVPDIQKAKRNT
jgi:hypothetical protein